MTVEELIEKLSEFPKEREVTISDGHDFIFYQTDGIAIIDFEGTVDIGIGGCRIQE